MMRVAARKTLYCVATSFLLTSVVNPAGFTPRFSRITLCEAARDIPSGKDKKGDTLSFEQWFAKLKSDDSNNDEKMDDFKKMVKGELQDGSLKGVRELFESGVPKEVGYGFLMGYSSGFCIKKVSRVVAVLVGGAFIFIQSLSYAGYIKVDHEKLQRDVEVSYPLDFQHSHSSTTVTTTGLS